MFQRFLFKPAAPRSRPLAAGAVLRSLPGLASKAAAAPRQLPPAEGDRSACGKKGRAYATGQL